MPDTRRSYRFPRASRLRRSADFRQIKARGKSVTGRYFIVATRRTGEELPPCLGIVTTRRIGGAVIRNRLRRQVRDIFRRNQHRILRGIQLVTVVRGSAVNISLRELEQDWLRLTERASILAAA
jgi:ribonuclease P protein component